MTVNEMHIAVNLGVQKIASFQADNLLPQEVDFELNIAMKRFIKQRYNSMSNRQGKGFEESQKRIDDLRTLVQENRGDTYTNGFYSDNIGSFVYTLNNTNVYTDRYTLPLDYMFLISVRAKVDYNCNSSIRPLLENQENYLDYVKVSLTPPSPEYTLSGINGEFGTGWENLLSLSTGTLLTPNIYLDWNNYWGVKPSENTPSQGWTNDTYALQPVLDSNHFYVCNTNSDRPFAVNSSSGGSVQTVWTINGDMSTAKYEYSDPSSVWYTVKRQAPDAANRISLCKFYQHDDIIFMMRDPFNSTSYDVISYTIQENCIDVYTDNTFVVPELIITYIRRPQDISIINGVGCELPEHTHQEIVEMTIKSILEGIESQRYQSQSLETFESE